jgi:chromate transporter
VTLGSLFWVFSKIGLCGFGGVAAWAHRVLVDERRWYSDRQYADLLSLGSVLPGPNVCNISIIVGDQFRGPLGSAVSLAGLLTGPLVILIILATLYERYGSLPLVQAIIAGVTAASAGLVLGTVIKLARRLRSTLGNLLIGVLVFIAAAILHLHVLLTVLIMIPLSLALTIWERRR